MERVFRFLEILWIIAIVAALVFAAYKFITTNTFDHYVYMPVIVAVIGGMVFYNIRNQRKFMEKRNQRNKNS